MKIKLKKLLAITLTLSLLLLYSAPVVPSFADNATGSATLTTNSVSPTPTPTPGPSTSVTATNSATVSNNVNSGSNTGGNTISATSSATLDATGSATLSSTDSANLTSQNPNKNNNSNNNSVNTGDAVSVTNAQTSVNSTSINSNVIDQTINIYVTQNGDINLSDPFTLATDAIESHPNDPVINMSVVNINNYSFVTNNVNSLANTGGNNIDSTSASAVINSGNAYSIVNLLNKVNFTIINSTIHVVTINLFGTLNGNIILPESFASLDCSGCGVDLTASNSATVTNNILSNANSGNNSITASSSANITTGNSKSVVNLENIINLNLINAVAESLYINLMGVWNGKFIGWYNFDPTTEGANLVFSSLGNGNCAQNCQNNLTATNAAFLTNNINSNSNTGTNSIYASNGDIKTGNSFSAVSLINFVNSTFINTYGFFGFLNIFGNWTGNIGGTSEFAALQNSQSTSNAQSTQTGSTQTMESGGVLNVTNTNNTGAFVNPGDTVTFFINTKNIGTGKVYGAQLQLFLIHNGQNVGGTAFNLGDIAAGKGVKLSTGFVLSKTTPPGLYTARAVVVGKVGPNNAFVTAFSDSIFSVGGLGTLLLPLTNGKNNISGGSSVMGSSITPLLLKNSTNDESQTPLYELLAVILAYFALRSIKERKKLEEIFQSNSFKEKMVALRMFLL